LRAYALSSCRDNVIKPLTNVREEFFETFTARAAYSESTRDDFEAGKRSLQRMLADFESDVVGSGFKAEGESTAMGVLLRHYEEELKNPIRNAVTGTLPRSLLIQVRAASPPFLIPAYLGLKRVTLKRAC